MISELMEFINFLYERHHTNTWKSASYHHALEQIMILVAPSAPYITEELWKLTGHSGSIHEQSWPRWDADLASDEIVEIAIQVDGKVRGLMETTINAGQVEVQEAALAHPKIQTYLVGRGVSKVIYIPGRVFNIVTHHID